MEESIVNFVNIIYAGFAFSSLYMIGVIIKRMSKLTDKISNLISISYEAEHNPDIKVDLTKQKDSKK